MVLRWLESGSSALRKGTARTLDRYPDRACNCVAKQRRAKGRRRFAIEQQREVEMKGGCWLNEDVVAFSASGHLQAIPALEQEDDGSRAHDIE
jgi:hypothetical protein